MKYLKKYKLFESESDMDKIGSNIFNIDIPNFYDRVLSIIDEFDFLNSFKITYCLNTGNHLRRLPDNRHHYILFQDSGKLNKINTLNTGHIHPNGYSEWKKFLDKNKLSINDFDKIIVIDIDIRGKFTKEKFSELISTFSFQLPIYGFDNLEVDKDMCLMDDDDDNEDNKISIAIKIK